MLLALFTLPGFAKTLNCEVTFDWISRTQLQRDENIKEIQNILFSTEPTLKYKKSDFKSKNKEFLKDKSYKTHYFYLKNGVSEDSEKKYSGFFIKEKLLYMYGIQYRNNLKNIYYYDTFGNLRYVDIFSDNYPKYPHYSLQYTTSGELIGTIYYVSRDDQYIFAPSKTFKGRWYKEKMYNKNAKVIMTRSNY